MASLAPGFVRRDGERIVDGSGAPALRRGVGIGNWLLPEGYMWHLGSAHGSPREIEALIGELVGGERAAEFWARFRRDFFNADDVAALAVSGFDHIRLPINARVVMDDDGRFLAAGFALVDACLDWCEAHGIRVILDLHGAPGGQTGTNIDDSPRKLPELFLAERYQELTERLWVEIARRYAGREIVGALDLLNEPLPNHWQWEFGEALAATYRRLTSAIRRVDRDHLIMYEGSHWANNWSIFTEVWDDNSALQFHKYWSPPTRESIAEYLGKRAELGLPIYVGESGENTPEWVEEAFALFESEGIGWNFWPWKKIDTITSPRSIVPPPGWDAITAFSRGEGPRPSGDVAWATLEALLANMRADACEQVFPVEAALFGERSPAAR